MFLKIWFSIFPIMLFRETDIEGDESARRKKTTHKGKKCINGKMHKGKTA